jgi:hypothetical protein
MTYAVKVEEGGGDANKPTFKVPEICYEAMKCLKLVVDVTRINILDLHGAKSGPGMHASLSLSGGVDN